MPEPEQAPAAGAPTDPPSATPRSRADVTVNIDGGIALLQQLLLHPSPLAAAAAAWGLSDAAERGHASEVVHSGALPQLVRLLRHKDASVATQAARCAGGSVWAVYVYRKALLTFNAVGDVFC